VLTQFFSFSLQFQQAGIIEEMVSDTLDTLDETEMFEDEEAEGEVNAILSEIIGNKLSTAGQVPSNLLPPAKEKAAPVAAAAPEEEEDEDEELLNSMRERLKALQS
jgi:charged multivesicular body protein 3